jgi:hypothetical protein
MTQAIRLRRALFATLILTAILTVFPIAQGHAAPLQGSLLKTTTTKSTTLCPIDWRAGTGKVKDLIRCAARHFGVSRDKALYVANRESNFHPTAYNSWSCAKGIYQHLCKYWPSRADAYGYDNWSAYNARANIMVTMRMVKHYGWGAWGG